MSYVIGVDVGGTKIAAAVVDSEGKAGAKIKVPTEQHDTARSIGQIAEVAHRAADEAGVPWSEISAVGVAVPGIYYAATGKVWAPNLPGWNHIPLRDELAGKLAAPVVIDSDRAAYVTGEQWMGAAQGLSDVIFLAVGTGIGAGIISGGRLIRGAGDIAGAVGWFAVDARKKEIYRRMGCLEAECAGPSLGRRAGGEFTTEAVLARARQGDPFAAQVVEETVRYLAMGVANLVSALNPEMIVLGGGLMQAGDLFLEPLRREMLEWAQPIAARQVRLELSRLGEDAGLLGAARLAFLKRDS
jgi:glucokinase